MRRVVAVVKDLFFVARIRETAKLVGTPLGFARSAEELAAALEGEPPGLVIIDLTTPGWDHAVLLATVANRAPGVPVLGYTTHVLARQTRTSSRVTCERYDAAACRRRADRRRAGARRRPPRGRTRSR